MIDLEPTIFTQVVDELIQHVPEIAYSGEYVRKPAEFPFVSIVEMDNSTFTATGDSGSAENHALLTYEINIYSNLVNGKKRECRRIAEIIDEIMLGMNFSRISLKPVPNMMDSTIYRMTGRYRVMADAQGRLYTRR